LNCTHLLVDLVYLQDVVEKQYAGSNLQEELGSTPLEDPASFEESEKGVEWDLKLLSDKTDVYQFVGEQIVQTKVMLWYF
jgi:hypothetical protein